MTPDQNGAYASSDQGRSRTADDQATSGVVSQRDCPVCGHCVEDCCVPEAGVCNRDDLHPPQLTETCRACGGLGEVLKRRPWVWWCLNDDCDFETPDHATALRHPHPTTTDNAASADEVQS